MTYKKKLIVLSGVIAALALAYILSIFFDPRNVSSRTDAYSWLDPAQIPLISGITITNPGEEPIELANISGKWFVIQNRKNYPARHLRVEDFIASLSKKAPFPLRSSSASSHEKLSLVESNASRVVVSGGAGLPLLDLLIGSPDVTGRNVHMRKQGENEVRSGEDKFSAYIRSVPSSWYNLRLFPESEDGKIDVANIMQVAAYFPREEDAGDSIGASVPKVISRKNKTWAFNFELNQPDMRMVDSYVRDVLNAAGSGFSEDALPESMFGHARISLEIGNDSKDRIRTINFTPPNENDQCYAKVTGSDWIYIIPAWTMSRFFPDFGTFGAQTDL